MTAPDRGRQWIDRARSAPARVEQVAAALARIEAELDLLRRRIAPQDHGPNLLDLRHDVGGGVHALAEELHDLRGRIDARLDDLEGRVAGEARVLQRAAQEPGREVEAARLRAALGSPADLRPGLSVFVLTWNHAGYLPEALASALAALEALPPDQRGQLWVLDDASTDETADVLEAVAASQPDLRVVTARRNLGLTRARNVLLHACATTHALQLDADNRVDPDGVAALHAVAARHRATMTFGTVIRTDPDGRAVGVMSNEPPHAALLAGNYVDTMAVVDVARLRALGGWTTDAALEHLDDWSNALRLWRRGELFAFVPVVVGWYRVVAHSSYRSTPAGTSADRLARTWNVDGLLDHQEPLAIAALPTGEVVWATDRALAERPDLAPVEPAPPTIGPAPGPSGPRVLVVGPGGVANVGDDAITAAVCREVLRRRPGAAIDVVTDGHGPTGLPLAAAWLGTLTEDADHLDLDGYDLAVLAGGGSMTDLWEEGLIAPRAGLVAGLADAGVPVVASGQGIGPLSSPRSRDLVSAALGAARRVAVRDAASADLARELVGDGHGDGPVPTLTGDDTLLEPSPPAGSAPGLVVHLRAADYVAGTSAERDGLARAVAEVAADRGWPVTGLAVNGQEPEPEVATLVRASAAGGGRWAVVDAGTDADRARALLAGAEAVVAHSYHVALWALAAGRPTVLVAGAPYSRTKALGLADLAGQPPAVVLTPAEAADHDRLAAALARADGAAAARALAGAAERVRAWWADALASVLPTG